MAYTRKALERCSFKPEVIELMLASADADQSAEQLANERLDDYLKKKGLLANWETTEEIQKILDGVDIEEPGLAEHLSDDFMHDAMWWLRKLFHLRCEDVFQDFRILDHAAQGFDRQFPLRSLLQENFVGERSFKYQFENRTFPATANIVDAKLHVKLWQNVFQFPHVHVGKHVLEDLPFICQLGRKLNSSVQVNYDPRRKVRVASFEFAQLKLIFLHKKD